MKRKAIEREQLKNRTILLVEDDSNDVLLIKRAFRKAKIGNPIMILENGEKAINYMKNLEQNYDKKSEFLPAIIFLDLMLPRKSGFEVLEWLRSRLKFKNIPVIILTSSMRSIDINRAIDSGATSYLFKPIIHNTLAGIMRKYNIDVIGLDDNSNSPFRSFRGDLEKAEKVEKAEEE